MAGPQGNDKTRVDYGDKGSASMKDKQTGAKPQDKSIPQPTRAQRPIGGSENHATFEESEASPKTRPNTGGDKGGY